MLPDKRSGTWTFAQATWEHVSWLPASRDCGFRLPAMPSAYAQAIVLREPTLGSKGPPVREGGVT